jgi:hypothetical protein
MKNEKEINRYLQKQYKSNPTLMFGYDEKLRKKLDDLGIIKGEELLPNKLDYDTSQLFVFRDTAGESWRIQYNPEYDHLQNNQLTVWHNRDSVVLVTEFLQNWKFALLDIIPGGNKGIVMQEEYYIANGHNSTLYFFEIK